MDKSLQFTEGKIFSPLMRFVLPVLFATFLQSLYGAIDLLIVGQFGGVNADIHVSAVSTGSQIMMTVTFAITALAMGLTVFVGRKIGEGQKEAAGEIIGSGIFLFALIGVVLTAVMVLFSEQLAQIMHAPQEAFDQTVSYLLICSAGSVFIVAYNLVGSIFRGMGDSKIPLITVAIATVLNIFGDWLLVAVFHMGATGAAYATIFAQAVSTVLSILIIHKKSLPFQFRLKYIRPNWAHIGQILRLGVPIALQDLLVSVSFLFVLAIINNLGLTISAGVGVSEKICGFLMLVPSAFMQAMSAFVAQNIGAQKPDRATKALWYGILSSLLAGLLTGYVTFFHGDILSTIFTADAPIIQASAEYLKAYAIDCVLTAFLFCFIGYFNGCGNTTFVMLQGIFGAFAIRLPISWLMSQQNPVRLFFIGLATPVTTAVQIVMCIIFFLYTRKKK